MSNEELTTAIQNGEQGRMLELWNNVYRLVYKYARHYLGLLEGRGGLTIEDLLQTGYVALADAVESYDSTVAAFSTWLCIYLRKHFRIAAGLHGKAKTNDPINSKVSLNAPIAEEDGDTLDALIEDPNSTATFQSVEDAIWTEQLHNALENALSSIPDDMAEVLRLRNFEGLSLDEIGERWNLSRERVRQLENKGIRELRKPKTACTLRPFYDFDFYSGTGLAAFRNSGMSVQERYVAMEEERRERAWRGQHAEEERVKEALAEADRILARYRNEQRANNEDCNEAAMRKRLQ